MVTLRLFGGASLESGSSPITGRSAQRRRIAILALLALARRGLTRDKLIGFLWADHDGEKARRLLSESLYVLRKELGEHTILAAGDELRLNPDALQCDVLEFEDALERADFARAAGLYSGPFLDGFYVSNAEEFERWMEAERDRLARARGQALERLAQQASAEGRHQDAVAWWRRLTEQDAFSGRYALGLMQALEAAGNRAAALQHAKIHATLLREELDAEPDPHVAALAEQLRDSPEPVQPAAAPATDREEPAPAARLHASMAEGGDPPEAGTVTFLFSDIEGSTSLLRRLGPRYADLLMKHHAIVRDSIRESHGREVDTAGDGFFVAFRRARDAVTAAVSIQRRVAAANWPDSVALRIRIGLHTGEPTLTPQGYVGMDVHRAARICGVARGGQILLSSATRELLGGDVPGGLEIRDLGLHPLKDIGQSEHLYALTVHGLVTEPAARTPGDSASLPPAPPAGLVFAPAVSTDEAPAGSAQDGRRRWLRRLVPLSAIPVATLLVWLGLLKPRVVPYVAPTGPTTAVAVFPFATSGGDEVAWLREGMVNLLSHTLDGAGDLRAIDPFALLAVLSGRGGSDVIEPGRAQRIAEDFGAQLFVLGDVTRIGPGRVRVGARLYGLPGTAVVEPVDVEGSTDEIGPLVDDLTARLLEKWIGGPAGRLARTAVLTSDSLRAVKAWLDGEREFRAARYDRAVDAFLLATRIDSSFALAHYRLSMAAEWDFAFELVNVSAQRALRYASGLSPNDHQLVLAWNDLIAGRAAEAEQRYREVTDARPDAVEAWYGLGEALVHFNPARGRSVDEARRAFAEVIELTPHYGDARFHMLEFAAADRDLAAFDSLLARVDTTNEQRPAWLAVRAWGWGTADERAEAERRLQRAGDRTVGMAAARVGAHLHDLDGAHRLTDNLVTRPVPDDWRAGGHIMQAQLDLAAGRHERALTGVAAAEELERGWALEMRGLFALPGFLPVTAVELAAVRDAIALWAPDDQTPSGSFFFGVHVYAHRLLRLYLLAMTSVRLGDASTAQRYRAELERFQASPLNESLKAALVQSLRASLARARGETAEALRLLAIAPRLEATIEQVGFSPFYSRAYDRLVMAELYFELGQDSAAIPWYRSLTEGYDVLFLAPAHLRLSQIYGRLGDTAESARQRALFEDLWGHADPGVRGKALAPGFW